MSLFALSLAVAAAADAPRLNEIQALGSHNSYHVAPPAALLETLRTFHSGAAAWDYTHPPLRDQLDAGLRQFELDIYADDAGGKFASPLGVKLAGLKGVKLPPHDPDGVLAKPGFKVLHVPDIDCWSNAPTLTGAIAELAAWSDKHPGHLPVMVLVECKDERHTGLPTKPDTFTRERLLACEKEILSVLPASRILRPDDIRGESKSLREAVLRSGWPTLESARGKFIFCLDNTNVVRDRYLEENPSLEGRLMFASAPDEAHPAAGWFKCNDPVREHDRIRELTRAGFLVRTRADTSGPDEAMRGKAFSSGAQWISTDHYAATPAVAFPGGLTARWNPHISPGREGKPPAP